MNKTLKLKNEKIIYPKPIMYPGSEQVDEGPSSSSIECYNALVALIKEELGTDYDLLREKYNFTPGLGEGTRHTE